MNFPELLDQFQKTLAKLIRIYRIRFDKSAIDTVDSFVEYIHTRAAYVAQTSLYGYLKTRMGRDYIKIFKDEEFAPSLNKAKWQIYAACLSDLTIFSVARVSVMDSQKSKEFALYCHQVCLEKTFSGETADELKPEVSDSFAKRCEGMIWANARVGLNVLTQSPAALANSSPVSDEFKELDREIVMNSVRFRWSNICDELEDRLNCNAVWKDWQQIAEEDHSTPLLESSDANHQG